MLTSGEFNGVIWAQLSTNSERFATRNLAIANRSRVSCAHNTSIVSPSVSLQYRLGVIQGHGKWYHSKACIRFPIRIPLVRHSWRSKKKLLSRKLQHYLMQLIIKGNRMWAIMSICHSNSGTLQSSAVTSALNTQAVISRKRCKVETWLPQTTNRKLNAVYQLEPFLWPWLISKSHSDVSRLGIFLICRPYHLRR